MSNYLEISFNSLANTHSLATAILFQEPFIRIMIGFGIVAAIRTLAQGNDILRGCTRVIGRWISQRYPMIHRQFVPKSLRTTTNGAAIVPILQGERPIGVSKRVWQVSLFSKTPLLRKAISFRVFIVRPFEDFLTSLWMPLVPFGCPFDGAYSSAVYARRHITDITRWSALFSQFRCRIPVTANLAYFAVGQGDVQHSVSLSLISNGCRQAVRLAAVSGLDSLADKPYYTRIGG